MKCKDIPELPILELLMRHRGEWCFIFSPEVCGDKSVRAAMPDRVPEKLALAKMSSLIRRGLVTGCDCGCRGDFEITQKGAEYLAKMKGGNSCSQQS